MSLKWDCYLLEANIESRHQCPRIPFVQQGDTGGIWQNGITFVWFENALQKTEHLS